MHNLLLGSQIKFVILSDRSEAKGVEGPAVAFVSLIAIQSCRINKGLLLATFRTLAPVFQNQLDGSARHSRHSSTLCPCPLAPGISGDQAANHSPSHSMTAVNSFFIAEVQRGIAIE